MAIIPTFNNLDLMENIRKGSLNPTITAVNELVAKSATLPKFSGSFKDNELARWDTSTGSFEPSGVLANNGEIHMSPNTLYFGNHSMSSGVENVLFKNLFTGKTYAPLWQSVEPGTNTAAIRGYTANQTDVKIPKGDIDVTNPINKGVVSQQDWSFNGLVFWLSEYTQGVVVEVFNSADGTLVYKHSAGDLAAGEQTVMFSSPMDFRKTFIYDVKLTTESGADVKAKSNSNTGFSFSAIRNSWEDIPLATQQWVKDFVHPSISDKVVEFGTNRPAPFNSDAINLSRIDKDLYIGKVLTGVGDVHQTVTLPDLATQNLEPGSLIQIKNGHRVQGLWLSVFSAPGQTIGGRGIVNLGLGMSLVVAVPYDKLNWDLITQPTYVAGGVLQQGRPLTNQDYDDKNIMKPVTQIIAEPGVGSIAESETGFTLVLKDTSIKSLYYDTPSNELKVTGMDGKVSTVVIPVGSGGGSGGGSSTEIDALKSREAGLETKVDTLGTRTDGLESTSTGFGTKLDALKTRVDNLERTSVSSPMLSLNTSTKTITATFTYGGQSHTQTLDLSPLFQHSGGGGGGTPATKYKVRYGFIGSKTPTSGEMLASTTYSGEVTSLKDFQVNAVRSENGLKYLFFWQDDGLPTLSSFNFGGFSDYWASQKFTVDGVQGTLFISDNMTHATNVTYGVNV